MGLYYDTAVYHSPDVVGYPHRIQTKNQKVEMISCQKKMNIIKLNKMNWYSKYIELAKVSHCINNDFEVLEYIGDGGFARVFKIRGKKTLEPFALKVLRYHMSQDNEYRKRFSREAEICSRLYHPGIVKVKEHSTGLCYPYMIQEYIEGISLKELIKENAPFDMTVAKQIALEVLSAIGYLHENGILHGDIKAGNVILASDTDRAVMIDFGLAIDLSTLSKSKPTMQVMGSSAYMSPELISGKRVGFESDIYSFGIMLYEMIVGTVPFEGKRDVDVFHQHLHAKLPFPEKVPWKLREILEKACAKMPAKRFRSTDELLSAIRDL